MKEPTASENPGRRRAASRSRSREERWTEPSEIYRPADGLPESPPSREERIAVLAYFKAERRGFAGMRELDDWLEAEREIDGDGGQGLRDEQER